MQDRCQHDQGQNARGDPKTLQHHERVSFVIQPLFSCRFLAYRNHADTQLHPRGGGADPKGERVGRGVSFLMLSGQELTL